MKILLLVAACALASGCYVQTRPANPPPPGYEPAPQPAYQEAPPPEGQPPPAPGQAEQPIDPNQRRARVNAPPTPDVPALSVTVQPGTVRRGYEATVYLNPFQQYVTIYLNGQSLAKHLNPSGDAWVVLIPADAGSGYVEVDWNGNRYRSGYVTVTP